MAYGLLVRVHHTGLAADSVFLSDIDTAVDDQGSFRKAGGVYVPTPAKGGYVDLVYTRIVSISFETGAIRKFEDNGYVWTEFIIGDILAPAVFPTIEDEGIVVDPATQIIDFVGAGVTATQTAPGEVQVTIPGGAVGTDHATLVNLNWLVSNHSGNVNTIAGFDGAGAPRYYLIGTDLQAWDADLDALAALAGTGVMVRTGAGAYSLRTITGTANHITVTNGDGVAGNPTLDVGANVILTTTALGGDLNGFLPNPTVTDLTIVGEVQGSVLYFNGVNWVQLAPGVAGEVLQTGGPAANPSWAADATGSTQLLWGDNSVGSTATTRYLTPGYDDSLAETSPTQIRVVRAGTLRNFRVRHNVTAGNGNNIVYTFRVNGIASALIVTLASTAADGSDLANSVVVAAGDLVDIEVTKAAGVGTSPGNIVGTVEYA